LVVVVAEAEFGAEVEEALIDDLAALAGRSAKHVRNRGAETGLKGVFG